MKAGRGKEMEEWVGGKVNKLARRRKRYCKETLGGLNDFNV